ncbi:MAG: hypothetical protein COV66_03980 [Nitrospinae bacterium CG11_big_fil_rev_8_21_14_0_20_45_15]|nr:MAG: hypothetical protein COV66_03980 [Nitrospinae bacterium CG11_big_fil_rev_8_21_14_0_20_45_15]
MDIQRKNNKLFFNIKIRFCFLLALAFIFSANLADAKLSKQPFIDSEIFHVPRGLETRVNFWKDVYSKYPMSQAIVHDADDLSIVYEVVDLGSSQLSRRDRDRKTDRVKAKYRAILRKLDKNKHLSELSSEDHRVYHLVKENFKKAARNIRVQIGQSDRFQRGIERSGLYMDEIRRIFRNQGLPEELRFLPHVESSFYIGAYSSAGAAGIWQFTRGTGRLFMKVGYDVDERRDPILSSHAAAKLLKLNYQNLQNWPLAITAYNHGLNGMKRAQKKIGNDFAKVIDNYRSNSFGFASKNFYAEFLAAVHVAQNKEAYFPNLNIAKPFKKSTVRFDDYVHIDTIAKHWNLSKEEIAEFNPSLRQPVISGEKRIPEGYVFQVPATRLNSLAALYNRIPPHEKYPSQVHSQWHTVRRGQTLSGIAKRYGTTVSKLKLYNSIGRKNQIYIGQVLTLPGRGQSDRPRSWSKPVVPAEEIQMVSADNIKSVDSGNGQTVRYRVRKKDNLTKIARRFDSSVQHLARINSIRDMDALSPGQWLRVPAGKVVSISTEGTVVAKLEQVKSGGKLKSGDFSLEVTPGEEKISQRQAGQFKMANLDLMNQKRPAFRPVSFQANSNNKSRVGRITVDFDETLSHYSEWAKVSVRSLRQLNKMGRSKSISVHDKLNVPFTHVSPESFEEKRQEYHKAIQEDFFNNYEIKKLVVRNIKKGETLWEICNDNNSVPLWLLSSYNAEKDIRSLSVGEPIVIPQIVPSS